MTDNKSNMVWTEKYRPKNLDEIIGQPEIVALFKGLLKVDIETIPHYMLIGPGGSGKTSIVRAFAEELGVEFRAINASRDRGIEYVREELQRMSKLVTPKKRKIVFMDEFDNVTPDAQFVMRGMLEDNWKTTIFFFSLNYRQKIIKEVADRTTELYFNPLKPKDLKQIVPRIEQTEGIKFDPDVIEQIAQRNHGSARNFIIHLFNYHTGGYLAQDIWDVKDYISRIKMTPTPSALADFYEKISSQDFLYQLIRYLTQKNINDRLTEVILKLGDYAIYNPSFDEYSLKLVVGHLLWRVRDLL